MSIEYIPGPPTELGLYMVILKDYTGLHSASVERKPSRSVNTGEEKLEFYCPDADGLIKKEDITHYAGPFVFPEEEKQTPLIRMFRYEKDGETGIGVKIEGEGLNGHHYFRYYTEMYGKIREDIGPNDGLEKRIAEWIDIDDHLAPTEVDEEPTKNEEKEVPKEGCPTKPGLYVVWKDDVSPSNGIMVKVYEDSGSALNVQNLQSFAWVQRDTIKWYIGPFHSP